MQKILLIALGGGAGAALRHVVGNVVLRFAGASFPYSALMVNVSGCLLFGGLAAMFASPQALREELRGVLLIGLLGGYTTYSTYAWQTVMLAEEGAWGKAFANVLVTTVLGFGAIWVGYRLGTRWFGA
jgi:CrcB protein